MTDAAGSHYPVGQALAARASRATSSALTQPPCWILRIAVERDLAMLPDDDKLVLFHRHRNVMVSMAENVTSATPEQLRERNGGVGPVSSSNG